MRFSCRGRGINLVEARYFAMIFCLGRVFSKSEEGVSNFAGFLWTFNTKHFEVSGEGFRELGGGMAESFVEVVMPVQFILKQTIVLCFILLFKRCIFPTAKSYQVTADKSNFKIMSRKHFWNRVISKKKCPETVLKFTINTYKFGCKVNWIHNWSAKQTLVHACTQIWIFDVKQNQKRREILLGFCHRGSISNYIVQLRNHLQLCTQRVFWPSFNMQQ